MEKVVLMETNREGYSIDDCYDTLTVKELINILEQFDEDSKVYYSNDKGYTYGAIYEYDIDEIDKESIEQEED